MGARRRRDCRSCRCSMRMPGAWPSAVRATGANMSKNRQEENRDRWMAPILRNCLIRRKSRSRRPCRPCWLNFAELPCRKNNLKLPILTKVIIRPDQRFPRRIRARSKREFESMLLHAWGNDRRRRRFAYAGHVATALSSDGDVDTRILAQKLKQGRPPFGVSNCGSLTMARHRVARDGQDVRGTPPGARPQADLRRHFRADGRLTCLDDEGFFRYARTRQYRRVWHDDDHRPLPRT